MNENPDHGALYGGNPPSAIGQTPLIINACLSGNVTSRNVNPHVPTSIGEIVNNALEVIDAGATMLHIHAYEEDGTPTWRPDVFGRIFSDIRPHAPEAILIATTSGRLHGEYSKRSAVLELTGDARPDMASLTLGSLNFPNQASLNAPDTVQRLCMAMRENEILPELEVFDLGMLNYAFYLQRRGFLPLDCYVNLMLGSLGTVPGRLLDLTNISREIPGSWTWAAAGIGRYQLQINTAALLLGGHVRVGLEDNPYYDYANREPASNVQLVKRIVRLAKELGRPIATCNDTRTRLKLGQSENWTATKTVIRKLRLDDTTAVMQLLGQWNMAPIQPCADIPAPERDRLEAENTFVAILKERIVGVASYLNLGNGWAETASLAVAPEYLGCGIGFQLQQARLKEMGSKGIIHVRTESDRPEVIRWYIDKFGYRVVGQQAKKHAFGRSDCNYWTILELDLEAR